MFTDKEDRQIDRAVTRAAKLIDNELEKMFRKLPESAAYEMAMRLVGELLVKTQPPFLIDGLVLGLVPDELGREVQKRAVHQVRNTFHIVGSSADDADPKIS
jgi:hypothetical protein